MTQPELPPWMRDLEEEDLHFVRRFVLASGSLKALAAEYGVSYPTLRSRLDRLIARIRVAEAATREDPFQRALRLLVADGQIKAETARRLLQAHRDSLNPEEDPS